MKVSGIIGFEYTENTGHGVWKKGTTKKKYYMDINRVSWYNRESQQTVNGTFIIQNTISVLLNPFLLDHYTQIKWLEFQGTKWKVSSVSLEEPHRLILSVGERYASE
jgi:hypothetical protein